MTNKAVVYIDISSLGIDYQEVFEGTIRENINGIIYDSTPLVRAEDYARRVLAKGYYNHEHGIGFPAHRIYSVRVMEVTDG